VISNLQVVFCVQIQKYYFAMQVRIP